MYLTDYFHYIQRIISQCPAIVSYEVIYDHRTKFIGFIKGILTFPDSSELHFREFIDVEAGINRYKYAYHYQKDNGLIFRYDNYPHFGQPKSPDHKHLPIADQAILISSPDLEKVLEEIILLLE